MQVSLNQLAVVFSTVKATSETIFQKRSKVMNADHLSCHTVISLLAVFDDGIG